MVLDASLLNTQHYKVWIKGKVEQTRERSSALPTPWCSSYRKGNHRVTLDYGRQLYLLMYPWKSRTLDCIWWWGSSFGALSSMEYFFVAITSSSKSGVWSTPSLPLLPVPRVEYGVLLRCHYFQFYKMCLEIIYIWYICMKRIQHWITYNVWYAIKPNQTKTPNLNKTFFFYKVRELGMYSTIRIYTVSFFFFFFFCSGFNRPLGNRVRLPGFMLGDLTMTSIAQIAPNEIMTSIDQQRMSFGSCTTSPSLNLHYKKTLCQILPGRRHG